LGGRKDGLHARQPFTAFPREYNNTDIFVIDVHTQQFWSAPLIYEIIVNVQVDRPL
jgi:hypothetical protein